MTDRISGSSIHLTTCGDAVFLFTDKGDLIRAAIEKANELNDEFPGANVDWRSDILGPGLTSDAAAIVTENQQQMADEAGERVAA